MRSNDCSIAHEPFCHHLIHLFSQLSALATMGLHVNKAGLAAANGINVEWLRNPSGDNLDSAKDRPLRADGPPPPSRSPSTSGRYLVSAMKQVSHEVASLGAALPHEVVAKAREVTSSKKSRKRHAQALNDTFTKEELEFYESNRGCAVHTTVMGRPAQAAAPLAAVRARDGARRGCSPDCDGCARR